MSENGAMGREVNKFCLAPCVLLLLACAPRAATPSAPPGADGSISAGESDPSSTDVASQPADTDGAGTTTPTEQGESGGAARPAPQLSEAERQRLGLPEVVVENIGLHIGGESNSPESKQPFIAALDKQFEAFRWCYRFIETPGKGGVFGVDLMVPREGGAPTVRSIRTTMAGEEFRGCMVAAFGKTAFDAPRRPVVFSYSVRFTLKRGAGVE